MIREWTVEIASENGWSASAVFLVASSRVTFRDLSESEIAEYIASGEWRNKGGGYAVQGNAAYLIAAVGGMFTNVVGLPMSELSRILASRFNIHPVESLVQQRNRPRAANV
jgi:predicted house-cleaning NTP pyrophosphatase (Maf/HAM1 superfamily)